GATVVETIEQVLTQEPVSPALLQPKVPRDLETICLKCLHKEPSGRYAGAAALAGDLERFLAGEPISVRGSGLVEQATRLLSRSQYDVRFHTWGTRLLKLAGLPLLTQLPAFVLAVTGGPGVVAAPVLGGLGGASTIALALWLGQRGRRDATGPAERLLWSILFGNVLAMFVTTVVAWPTNPDE